MEKYACSVIVGSGKYLPTRSIPNTDFLQNDFLDNAGQLIEKTNSAIITQFEDITGIKERVHVAGELVTSDIAYFAAIDAIQSSGVDPETIDYIIVAHNFGDVKSDNQRTDMVPSLAARVKHKLQIRNPYCVAYDLPFGCPGWVQALIQADYYLKSGDAKTALVIGAEILSRVSDPHDRDSMLYSDGAGAVILQRKDCDTKAGVLAHKTRSDTFEHAFMLSMGPSYNPKNDQLLYLKMKGRKLYEYALNTVAGLVKETIEKSGLELKDISKVLIHQANAKMDDAILKRLFQLYDSSEIPTDIMPMTIEKLGNNSVATIPILYDIINKGEFEGQKFNSGDKLAIASVGAGMNINCIIYSVV